jgi:biotin carboxyl carrier protein
VSTQKYASMATEDLKEGTGLFDNVDGRVTAFKLTKEAPEGYAAEGNPIFAYLYLLLDGTQPEDERKVSQSYSLGAMAGDNFDISEDGYGLIPKNDDAAIRKDSKYGTFISVLETSGFPKPILQAGDMSKVIGLYGHWKRVADKERNFSEDQRTRPGQKKTKFPPSTLVCTKILALPGEAAKTAAAPATATATAPASTASATPVSADDLDTQVGGYLLQVLAEKGGSVQRAQLTLLLSKAAMKEPNRQDIARRGADEAYLATMVAQGFIKYDPAAKPQVVTAA